MICVRVTYNIQLTQKRYKKLNRLLGSLVKSVQNAPDRRGCSGFNSQWRRDFFSVYLQQ